MSFSQDSQGFTSNPQSNSFKLEEVGLPKSTLWNFIKEVLAENNVKGEKAICPLIDKITIHYINYLSSLGSSICLKNGKKTLNIEHILEALNEMHFEKHIKSITNEPYFNENNNNKKNDSDDEKKNFDVMNVKQLINKKKKRSNKRKKFHLTEEDLEELAREQKEMFENARREQMNKIQILNNQINVINNENNNLNNTNNINNINENIMNSNNNYNNIINNEKKEENINKNNNIKKYEDIFTNNEQEDNFD